MKQNPWRTLRLAGATTIIAAYFLHNPAIILFGSILIALGTINGLLSLERRVEVLEEKSEKTNSQEIS